MTEVATQARVSKRDKARRVADDVVTANSLATHLGMTRQNVAQLTAAAIIEQRGDGHYDQTATRLRYIKHLRSEHRRSPRTEADAAHVTVKTEMLKLRLMEKRRELVRQEDVTEMIDNMIGLVLTKLGGWPARIAGTDLVMRRRAEAVLRELQTEIAVACEQMADKNGEPPLDQQG